jgi:flagellar protein FliJ
MKRFRFNLQRVLDYRKTMEDMLLGELGAIRAEYERESARLEDMSMASCRYSLELKRHLADGDPDEIRLAYGYLEHLGEQMAAQQEMLRGISRKKEQKTTEVVEASRDRKVMERLKDYKVIEHRQDAEREQQKFLDDVASIRHNRAASAADTTTGMGR